MTTFVSVSDSNYLIQGLTLYESIKRHIDGDFKLIYLALDQITEDKLRGLPNIEVWPLYRLAVNPRYKDLISKQSIAHGLSDFHFCLASFFCDHLLNVENIPVNELLYVDADIFFYDNPNHILNNLGGRSVSFGAHKHIPFDPNSQNPGCFNVGAVYFKNTLLSRMYLSQWQRMVLDCDNPIYYPFNACYDQKFLELLYLVNPNHVKVMDYDVGHIAPWNMTMMTFVNGKMEWHDTDGYLLPKGTSRVQNIVFSHFAHFNPNYVDNTYKVDRKGEWGLILTHPGVKEIYDGYFEECKRIREKYKLC